VSAGEHVRIFLVDDHTLVRAGVRRILESHPGLEVVGEVADGREALAALGAARADVLVVDLTMPGMDGFEVMRTMHARPEYVMRAIEEGADGYLLKDSAVQDLVTAIHEVRQDRVYYSAAVQQGLTELLRERKNGERTSAPLTERELEVLRQIAIGLSTKEIAARLEISTRTVETHRANLMRKLGLRSVALLTQYAMREGLLGPPPP
jgi:DNA-binding NarL/FixJ family response regulator